MKQPGRAFNDFTIIGKTMAFWLGHWTSQAGLVHGEIGPPMMLVLEEK